MSYESMYPHLFEPMKVGNKIFKNRIIFAPTCIWKPYNPDPALNYVEERARGGAAAVYISQGWVDTEHGMDSPDCGYPLDTDECVRNIAPYADAIHKHGALAAIEMQHAGMNSFFSFANGHQVDGPVEMDVEGGLAGEEVLHGEPMHVLEMPEEIILETIEKFAQAAYRVKTARFDMIMLHAGHGWFIHQFMSPTYNTRTDKWGGSFENRMRLPIEICKRIREVCGPDLLIEFRMSTDELNGGYSQEVGVEIAKAIDPYVDLIHASCGRHEDPEAFVHMHPSMFLEDGCNRYYAEEVKKAGVKSPVVSVGGFSDPGLMEKFLADGAADFISIARGLIADPYLPLKAKAGEPDEIVQCMRCHLCQGELVYSSQFRCTLNPRVGFEQELKSTPLPSAKKKVMVAGGGIAGMMAALTAAKRGHEVVLFEKKDRLGGVLLCEEEVPFKKKQSRFINQQARHCMENENIEVRLNTAATKEVATEINPDVIVCAVGSVAKKPGDVIKGAGESPLVADCEELYYDINKAGKKVVVIGGGFTAGELAVYLAMNGRDVTLLVRSDAMRTSENIHYGLALMSQFRHLGIDLRLSTPTKEITDKGVIIETENGEELVEADTVACAVGRQARFDVVKELSQCAPEFYSIGDVFAVKDIRQANNQGYYTGLDIGTLF